MDGWNKRDSQVVHRVGALPLADIVELPDGLDGYYVVERASLDGQASDPARICLLSHLLNQCVSTTALLNPLLYLWVPLINFWVPLLLPIPLRNEVRRVRMRKQARLIPIILGCELWQALEQKQARRGPEIHIWSHYLTHWDGLKYKRHERTE